MKFFNNGIYSKSVTLAEAAEKASTAKKPRSLDELLAEAASGQVKTASASTPQVKTASTEAAAPVVAPVVEETKVEVKTAGFEDFINKKKEEKKDKEDDGVEEVKDEEKKDEKKDDSKLPDFLKKKEASSSKIMLKVAKSHDFRGWSGEDIIKGWKQHGTIEACKKNVAKFVSDPCTYCGLLSVASTDATNILKTKVAAASTKGKFTMIAKLSKEDKDLLGKYFTQIYGKEYVDALLEDY